MRSIIVTNLYFTLWYFNVLGTLKSFQTVNCFHFPPKVVHFKQASINGFHSHLIVGIRAIFCHFSSPTSKKSESFFDLLFWYLKSLFPINKQFSIDSFLDWDFAHLDQTTATLVLMIHKLKEQVMGSDKWADKVSWWCAYFGRPWR